MQNFSYTQGACIPPASYVGDAARPPGVEEAAPPSTYAVAAVLDGHEGAAIKLIGLTALRSVFIVPGIYIATRMTGAKLSGGQVVAASLASSCTISAGMLAWYGLKRCFPGVI